MTCTGVLLADGDQRVAGDEHRDLACHQLAGRGPQADRAGTVEQAGDNGPGLGRWRSRSPASMASSSSPNPALIIVFRRNLIGGPSRTTTTAAPGLALSTPAAGGIAVAELSGELNLARAPALREQLLGLLRPGSSRLVIDCPR
jgi:hypothetical protein